MSTILTCRSYACLCLLFLIVAFTPAQVVINEFSTGTPDFVELRNLGISPANIGGWVLSTWYSTSGGSFTAEPPYTLPLGTTIPAGGILVLQETGVPGQPGSLGCSISVGTNYQWANTRSIILALTDNTTAGVDYVLRDLHGFGGAPNLPSGTAWSGSLTASGDFISRTGNVDTNTASDWTNASPSTPCSLNPGQSLPSPVSLTIATTGVGDSVISISTMPVVPGAQFYTLVSLQDYTPTGSGPVFGVGYDVIPQFAWAAFPGNPFHSNLDGAGQFNASFGAGSVPLGLFIEAVTVVINGATVVTSDAIEVQY